MGAGPCQAATARSSAEAPACMGSVPASLAGAEEGWSFPSVVFSSVPDGPSGTQGQCCSRQLNKRCAVPRCLCWGVEGSTALLWWGGWVRWLCRGQSFEMLQDPQKTPSSPRGGPISLSSVSEEQGGKGDWSETQASWGTWLCARRVPGCHRPAQAQPWVSTSTPALRTHLGLKLSIQDLQCVSQGSQSWMLGHMEDRQRRSPVDPVGPPGLAGFSTCVPLNPQLSFP